MRRFFLGLTQRWMGGAGKAVSRTSEEAMEALDKAGARVIDKSGNVIERSALGNVFNGIGEQGFFSKLAGKVFKLSPLAIVGGIAEYAINGRKGLVGGFADRLWTDLGITEANQNAVGKFQGFYKMLQEMLALFGIQNDWIDGKVNQRRDEGSLYDSVANTVSENPVMTGAGIGATVLGVKGYQMYKNRGTGTGFDAGPGGSAPTDGPWGPRDGGTPKAATAKNPVTGIPDVNGRTVAKVAEEAVESGGLKRMFTRSVSKMGIIGAVAAPIALFTLDKAFGATNEEAADLAKSAIPFNEAVGHFTAGDIENGLQATAVEGASYVGFGVGASTGMAIGASVGSIVPVAGTFVGGAVGFVAGGLIGSGVASTVTDYAWEGGSWVVGQVAGFFQADAPEPTRQAVLENMNGQFDDAVNNRVAEAKRPTLGMSQGMDYVPA